MPNVNRRYKADLCKIYLKYIYETLDSPLVISSTRVQLAYLGLRYVYNDRVANEFNVRRAIAYIYIYACIYCKYLCSYECLFMRMSVYMIENPPAAPFTVLTQGQIRAHSFHKQLDPWRKTSGQLSVHWFSVNETRYGAIITFADSFLWRFLL